MKLKHFFTGVIFLFLLSSCIGEDVQNTGLNLSVENQRLFSIALDESNEEILQLTTNLDDGETTVVIWNSLDPEVINITPSGRLLPSDDSNRLGEEARFVARAFDKSNIDDAGTVIDGAEPLVTTQKSLTLAVLTISLLDISGVEKEELTNIAKFGFEERLIKNRNLTSIDVNDLDQQLLVSFTNFERKEGVNVPIVWTSSDASILDVDENGVLIPKQISDNTVKITATVEASQTKRGLELSQEFEIIVGGETTEEEVPVEVEERVLIASGSLRGENNYTTRGDFQIFREPNGEIVLEIEDNFSTRGIVFGLYVTSGSFPLTGIKEFSRVSPQRATLINGNIASSGAQTFTLNVDITRFDTIYINCERIDEATGIGTIEFK